ncbi:MAG: KGG domain-containing protein [Pseudomonadota bacterium]
MASSKEGNKQSGSRGSQGSGTSNRGFASMDPERQREIASEGGKAAHQKGTAHEFTSEEARRAGSMSHGNRQADQSSSRSGGSGDQGNKQGAKSGNRSGGESGGGKGAAGGNKQR